MIATPLQSTTIGITNYNPTRTPKGAIFKLRKIQKQNQNIQKIEGLYTG